MIADDRKESCFHTIANDRRADCSHIFRSAEMSNVLARSARGKSKQTTWRTSGGNLAARKYISFFSPKATTTSASKSKETSKNSHEEIR